MTLYERADWARLLCAHPAAEVKQAASDLAYRHTVEDLTLPQAGLGLMQLRDSALRDAYFLGEIPLARAHVRVTTAEGRQSEGGAQLLDDRSGLARAVAILDAVLAGGLPGAEAVVPLLERGRERCEALAAERRAQLAATRVDFSLLGTTDEEDEDV
ncbi:phosphonate C-P lyase system protein PhnG [Sedimenticola hydrogenitrophicus]|uniref:phosphonate C-P lyase system protein PhnG n=1 Tax=Sedimenticola hydrogenitrophicus TaxID=2967975 RepID=UPI0023B14DD2|nr:phosphonate C-P lyase system protein PhnG [Sedimenticola hydrogenitrophicus]